MMANELEAIRPGTPGGDELGLTPPRFGPKTILYRDGLHVIFANLDIHDPQPHKVLHDLVIRTNVRGLIAVIPNPAGTPTDHELLEWGFTLQLFPGSRGESAYFRGPRGLPVVSTRHEKFNASVAVTDEGHDLGFSVRLTCPGAVLTVTVGPDGIRMETGKPPLSKVR